MSEEIGESSKGFFKEVNKIIEESISVLKEQGKDELADKLVAVISQVEKLILNFNNALFNSYKLSLSILESADQFPEETKEELKENIRKIIKTFSDEENKK